MVYVNDVRKCYFIHKNYQKKFKQIRLTHGHLMLRNAQQPTFTNAAVKTRD